MLVRIFSDVVCPWCWIGKRRWERALEQYAGAGHDPATIEVDLRPFQLDPDAPQTPVPLPEAYARKFGGPERAAAIIDRISRVAADEGLEFHLDRALRCNTFDAHRLLWLARHEGRQHVVEERLMRAYFTEGRDVSDHDVLT